MALVTIHAVASISSLDQSTMIDSVTNNGSTPLGWACPTLTHSSTMSSSCTEVASSRVPSPLAIARTHIQLRSLESLPRIWSEAAKVVTVDVVDISGWENEVTYWVKMVRGMLWCLEKSADYHSCCMKFTTFAKLKLITLITGNTNCIWE